MKPQNIVCPHCGNHWGEVALRWVRKPGTTFNTTPEICDGKPTVCPQFYSCEPVLKLRDDFDHDSTTGIFRQTFGKKPLSQTKHGKTKIRAWEARAHEAEARGSTGDYWRQKIEQSKKFPVELGIRLYIRQAQHAEIVCVCGVRNILAK